MNKSDGKDKYCMISHVESKKAELRNREFKRWLAGAGGWRIGEVFKCTNVQPVDK